MIEPNGYDKKDGLKILKDVQKKEELFQKYGIPTQHLSPALFFGDPDAVSSEEEEVMEDGEASDEGEASSEEEDN